MGSPWRTHRTTWCRMSIIIGNQGGKPSPLVLGWDARAQRMVLSAVHSFHDSHEVNHTGGQQQACDNNKYEYGNGGFSPHDHAPF